MRMGVGGITYLYLEFVWKKMLKGLHYIEVS